MARKIELVFEKRNIVAVADLLEEDAKNTCNAIFQALPISGKVIHAMYSGREIMIFFPVPPARPKPENMSMYHLPGDVIYYQYPAGYKEKERERIHIIRGFGQEDIRTAPALRGLGFGDEVAEIAIVYGMGRPLGDTQLLGASGLPVLGNLFARITENLEEFVRGCEEVRRQWDETLLIRKKNG